MSLRGYDAWKTTNPADEHLGPDPEDEEYTKGSRWDDVVDPPDEPPYGCEGCTCEYADVTSGDGYTGGCPIHDPDMPHPRPGEVAWEDLYDPDAARDAWLDRMSEEKDYGKDR